VLTVHRPHPRAWLERRRARAEADQWISHGFESRYPWRVAELTTLRERRSCARSLHGVLGELSGAKLPGPAPLQTAALRPHVPLFEQIEARLLDDEPVTAVGMLAVNELLTSPNSCLFAPVDDVAWCLQAVLIKLEVR
jgi:hypothetical protein